MVKKVFALCFVIATTFACSSAQTIQAEAMNDSQKVSESLARIKSTTDSTVDMFDEVAKKAKAGQ